MFKDLVESYGNEAEKEHGLDRLKGALDILGFDKKDGVGDKKGKGSLYFLKTRREFPLGKIKVGGSGEVEAVLSLNNSSSYSMFLPDSLANSIPREKLDTYDSGGVRMEVVLSAGDGAPDKSYKLGTLIGADRDGYPIITIPTSELEKGETAEREDLIHGEAVLDRESDRYKEAIMALYGAVDTIEGKESVES